jgi:hypothetical protein
MTLSQIESDIEKWSADRLKQWFCDSVERYKMADVAPRRALAITTSTLLTAAVMVSATPEESAKIVATIKKMSQKRS